MNTGERFQHFRVPRWHAVLFVRNPREELLKGYRFERVREKSDWGEGGRSTRRRKSG